MRGIARSAALACIALFLLLSLRANAQALDDTSKERIGALIAAFKTGDKQVIAEYIAYPLWRMAPIPSIKNRQQFIARYDEVFDETIIGKIIASNIENDWSVVGSHGIMFARGEMWIDFSGKIIGVNLLTEAEKRVRAQLIADQRSKLHESVREFSEPLEEWITRKYHIRIDDMGDHDYRYAAWSLNKAVGDKPDIELFHGQITYQGNGGDCTYTFSNGKYKYVCSVYVMRQESEPPGELEVYKQGKRILDDFVVKDLLAQ